MNRTILKPGCTLTFIFFLFSTSILAQNPFVLDSTLSSALPQSIANTIQVADIDNDGAIDLILSGYDSTRFGVFFDIINGN
ncbi:MAG: hypothetical protein HOE96_02645, partial [Candidatus Marinimicrobia bacterium]|nr:hypothetical protein [Candidatus Neomarinimicrobiota bacterium]